jgi:hypothetical protein
MQKSSNEVFELLKSFTGTQGFFQLQLKFPGTKPQDVGCTCFKEIADQMAIGKYLCLEVVYLIVFGINAVLQKFGGRQQFEIGLVI